MNKPISFPMRRQAIACAACLALVPAVQAQSAPAATTAQSQASSPSTTLPEVVVTGNPLASGELTLPVSVLSGDELVLRRGSSLGETLNSQPGVSSSYFGPNASRPIVRGLDGDRVRILSNAGASLDASSLSFDHAVPIDPLIVERLEVLRGPGALLYGGSAIGGVVNALDNRIPKTPLQGLGGAAELRVGGADSESGGAALVETGNGQYALHADAFARNTSDLRVPRFTPLQDGGALPEADRVRNSASRARGGAFGGSLFFGGGHVGLSVDTYDNVYGTPAEEGIHIDMKRDHLGLAFEAKDLGGGLLRAVRGNANYTDYRHAEVEADGAIGTVFKTRGSELRLEAEHAPLGSVRGTVGAQFEDVDFSALGDEAFVPDTRTRRQALFALEELAWAGGTTTGGVRIEHARVRSAGDEDGADPRFGAPSERSFSPRSASVSHLLKLTPQWSLTGALSVSERAPTSFELYANGLHAATGVFERGDATLQKERGRNLDVALLWKSGEDHLRLGAFASRFSRFISLEATGGTVDVVDDDGSTRAVAEYAFRPVRARMNGIELEGRHRLLDAAWKLDASGKLDFTRGTNRDTGEPLPRIAPLRMLVGLDARRGPWGGRIEVDHAARQDRVPATDVPTPSYTIVNLTLTRSLQLGPGDGLWFVKVGNVGDELAYSASTVRTVRDLSPLPGRSVKTGIRVAF
ncbi:TonB-dependent receptor [Piscinibacter sp. XHJ-5]|uniref:TonB-dependent receptor n=1 Tax=Piscinibacter sp. XHJ-5 TaxID=3037797 RepID=UPI002452D917|nr:TonB-dependent receptor [Piscinibacter sp. XHJ-5]